MLNQARLAGGQKDATLFRHFSLDMTLAVSANACEVCMRLFIVVGQMLTTPGGQ